VGSLRGRRRRGPAKWWFALCRRIPSTRPAEAGLSNNKSAYDTAGITPRDGSQDAAGTGNRRGRGTKRLGFGGGDAVPDDYKAALRLIRFLLTLPAYIGMNRLVTRFPLPLRHQQPFSALRVIDRRPLHDGRTFSSQQVKMADRVHRITMFKAPKPEDQQKLIAEYKVVNAKAQRVS